MMRSLVKFLLLFIVLCVAGCAQEVQFDDPNLEAAIREAIGKPDGAITEVDLQSITELEAPDNNISDITGIERCVNLEKLVLGGWQSSNEVADISPLKELTNLTYLQLSDNQISDVTPLAKLTKLETLHLSGNPIRHLSGNRISV